MLNISYFLVKNLSNFRNIWIWSKTLLFFFFKVKNINSALKEIHLFFSNHIAFLQWNFRKSFWKKAKFLFFNIKKFSKILRKNLYFIFNLKPKLDLRISFFLAFLIIIIMIDWIFHNNWGKICSNIISATSLMFWYVFVASF